MATVQKGSHLLLVLEEHKVQLLGRLQKAIEEVDPDGLFLFVLKREDGPLPSAPQLAEPLLWSMGSALRTSSPLHFELHPSNTSSNNSSSKQQRQQEQQHQPHFNTKSTSTSTSSSRKQHQP